MMYADLQMMLQSLIEGVPHKTANLANAAALLYQNLPDVSWAGFYLTEDRKTMRFDVVVSFDAADRKAVCREVTENVQQEFPDYRLQVTMDTDFAEG